MPWLATPPRGDPAAPVGRRPGDFGSFLESGLEVAAAPPLRQDIALVVVAASRDHLSNLPWPAGWPGDRLEAIWQQEQVNLAALVPGGRLIVAADTPHRIHIARPEFLAGIVQDIVDEVRGR